jgi:hypothetical protein
MQTAKKIGEFQMPDAGCFYANAIVNARADRFKQKQNLGDSARKKIE